MRRFTEPAVATLVLLLASGSALAAQDAPERRDVERRIEIHRAPRGPGHGPMVRVHVGGSPAERLLAHREELELSDEQVERLEALAERQRGGDRPDEAAMLRARADYIEATRGTIDLARARAALDRMADLRTDAAIARLQERKEALEVLTPAQREDAERLGGVRGRELRFRRGGPAALFDFEGGPSRFHFDLDGLSVPVPPMAPAPPAPPAPDRGWWF